MSSPSSPASSSSSLLHRRTPTAARKILLLRQAQQQQSQSLRDLSAEQQHDERPHSMMDLMNQPDDNNLPQQQQQQDNDYSNNHTMIDIEQAPQPQSYYSSPVAKNPRGIMRRRSSYDVLSATSSSPYNNNQNNNTASPLSTPSRRPILIRRAATGPGGMGDGSDRSESNSYYNNNQNNNHSNTNTPVQQRILHRVGSGHAMGNSSSRGGTPSSAHRAIMGDQSSSSRTFSMDSLPPIPSILQFGGGGGADAVQPHNGTPLRSSSTSSVRRLSSHNSNSFMDGSCGSEQHYLSNSSVHSIHAQQQSPSQRGGASRRRVRARRGSFWRWNSFSAGKSPGGFRCRAACDLPVKDTMICLVFLLACASGLFVGFLFVLVKGQKHTGGIYTPLISSRTHAPPWRGKKHTPVAVFYNMFVARDPFLAGVDRLIVEEQLGQVGTSFAASAGDLHVYYTSIGDVIEEDWIDSLCSLKYNMTCTQTQHYRHADEDATLSKLHHFCGRHPDHSVVYLHNKGSLHPHNKGQDRWRRTMTAAATSQLCLEPPAIRGDSSDQCNACGMLFQPLPAPHFPGNIFSATCEYVNQLLSPEDYHARNAVMDAWIRSETEVGLIQNKFSGLFPMEAHYTGRRRYESEHWLGSHPDLRPCDVSRDANKDYWLEQDRDYLKEFSFAMAPRHNISANWLWWSYTSQNATLTDPVARLRDYFLLRGILYRSLAFYSKIPERNSWYWKWFPDADMWEMAIDQFGGAAIAINALVQLPGEAQFLYPNPTVRDRFWNIWQFVRLYPFSGGSLATDERPRMTNALSPRVGDSEADDDGIR